MSHACGGWGRHYRDPGGYGIVLACKNNDYDIGLLFRPLQFNKLKKKKKELPLSSINL